MGAIKRWFKLWSAQWSDLKKLGLNRRAAETTGSVLVMRLDAIGDFILFLDTAKEYHNLYPEKKLVLLCKDVCIPFARLSGFFDECITPRELLAEQPERSFDLLIQTVYAKTREMDVIAASIPAVKKISIKPDESRINLSRALTVKKIRTEGDNVYDELIDTGNQEQAVMELDRNAAFIRGLGRIDFSSDLVRLKLPETVSSPELFPDRKYYIVFPGASSLHKMWGTDQYAGVIEWIWDHMGLLCIVCGSEGESWIFDHISQSIREAGRDDIEIKDYTGKTSLIELAELIRDASFLIGNDTSGIHIAAAVGTKSVCIAGDFAFGRFIPYHTETEHSGNYMTVIHRGMKCAGCVYRRKTLKCLMSMVMYRRFRCIRDISVEDVIEGVKNLGG